jgi:hypothetical protein
MLTQLVPKYALVRVECIMRAIPSCESTVVVYAGIRFCKTNLVRLMKRIDCKLSTRGKVSLSAYKRMSLYLP